MASSGDAGLVIAFWYIGFLYSFTCHMSLHFLTPLVFLENLGFTYTPVDGNSWSRLPEWSCWDTRYVNSLTFLVQSESYDPYH